MSIERIFTKDEFRRLLFLTFLGEWVINAHRGSNVLKEYEEILDKILGYAHKFGFDEYVAWGKESEQIEPSSLLEDECRKFMDEYEDKFFLAELADRLSQVDVEALVRHQTARPAVSRKPTSPPKS